MIHLNNKSWEQGARSMELQPHAPCPTPHAPRHILNIIYTLDVSFLLKSLIMKIPEMMLAVCLEEQGGLLGIRTVPVPHPKQGEVLVKMAAAPINPSDLARIKNISGEEDLLSFIPGLEGSGTVIEAGKGLIPRLWKGKRVACSAISPSSGTWAEYMVTSASYCFPIPKAISDEQGSMLLVNPMTAIAFFDSILHDKHRAIINSAAAGALGGMIRFLGIKYGISVINVVRNDQQAQMLKTSGAKYILNNTESDFPWQLQSLSNELKATLALDPISGSYTQQLLEAIPYGGTVMLYGNLSGEEQGTSLRPLVLDNKKIHGFYLGNWMKDKGILKTIRNLIRVRQLLKNDFKIKIQNRFPLDKAQQAVDTYLNNMTGGKVLLIPGSGYVTDFKG
jgi:NADPH2:quinone reductase